MVESLQECRRKIDRARELGTVVRTMKALAAASVGQYEDARRALTDYERTVRLGLHTCLRNAGADEVPGPRARPGGVAAIVFGSDQGLVGQFNESMAQFVAQFAARELATAGRRLTVWAVGQRVHARLAGTGCEIAPPLVVPGSVAGVTALVQQLLIAIEGRRALGPEDAVHVFFHRIESGAAYGPVARKLLPLDASWRCDLIRMRWPTANLPQSAGAVAPTLAALVREYVFVALFGAAAESLAAENAARLAAMQRAERSIDDLLDELGGSANRLRQSAIDAELFDVVAGFEALTHSR